MPKPADRFVGTGSICAALRGRECVLLDALDVPWRPDKPHITRRTATILATIRHGDGIRARGGRSAYDSQSNAGAERGASSLPISGDE